MPTLRESLETMTPEQVVEVAERVVPLAQRMELLLGNPATRTKVQRLLKEANPALQIPEVDALDAHATALKERDDRIAALERQTQETAIKERVKEQRNAVMTKFGLTEADMAEVEAMMVREADPIPTYMGAAQVFVAQRMTAQPTPSSIGVPVFEMPETDVWGKGIGNKAMLDRIAMQEANKALSDFRAGKAGTLGGPIRLPQ